MVFPDLVPAMSRWPLWLGCLLGILAYALEPPELSVPMDPDPVVAVALADGLDHGDAVIERRLLQDMAFLGYTGPPQVLLAEARRLGLQRTDQVVRRRLIEKQRAREMDAPSAEAVAAWVATNCMVPERFRIAPQPERWLTQRDLERQYPTHMPEIRERHPGHLAPTPKCRERAWALLLARERR